jgi:hypothetical protein
MRWVHATAGELSEPMVTDVWRRLTPSCSRATNCNSTPAISKSEFVRVPCGFLSDITWLVMSGGNSKRHTDGASDLIPLNHTPPAPNALASQKPM